MKKIVIENETGGSLIIKWSLDDVHIGAGEKIKIEVPVGEKLRVFKNGGKSSQICRAEHYHEEDVTRKWSFAPVVLSLILRSMTKTVKKFLNLSSRAKEIISESPKVLLYQHSGNFIKFADSEVENGSSLYE